MKLIPLICLLATLLGAADLHAQTRVDVLYDDGRAPEAIPSFTLPGDPGVRFLRANDVARLFRATQFWNASARKVVLGVGRTRFVLTVDTRVVVIDGEPVMMRTPARYDGGFVLVPLEFILEVASHYTPRAFLWDDGTLHVRGLAYNVEEIDFATAQNRTTVTIKLAEPLLYHTDTNTSGLIRLKVYGGRVDTRLFTVRESHGLVEGVRAEQTERDAYIYFDIDPETRRLHIDRNEDIQGLVLTLEKGDLPDIPAPDFEGRTTVQIFDRSSTERRTLEIRRVCIDPGHGGKDHGKTGATGTREKDVNLALAMAIRDRLERELDLEVTLTREDDRLVALTRRTAIANETGADLLLSIHCNSWFSKRTGGFEAYFLAPARSESERALARYENAGGGQVAAGGPSADIEFILWDLVQNEYINESSAFAEYIQKEMDERLGIRSRGVKQANFTVLQGAKMPAVLIETAFLSNPSEERMLMDDAFHRRVADGVVEAVRRLQERYR